MDLEDCLTPASCLVCKIIHVGLQADASAVEIFNNRSHHVRQYSWRIFYSYNFSLHLNLINFLTWALMGKWRKASLGSKTTYMLPYWNHFLTIFSSPIQKYTWQTYLLNFFRFRICLPLLGLLLYLGASKYDLTHSPWTWPTSQITPFIRSPATSVLRTLEW